MAPLFSRKSALAPLARSRGFRRHESAFDGMDLLLDSVSEGPAVTHGVQRVWRSNEGAEFPGGQPVIGAVHGRVARMILEARALERVDDSLMFYTPGGVEVIDLIESAANVGFTLLSTTRPNGALPHQAGLELFFDGSYQAFTLVRDQHRDPVYLTVEEPIDGDGEGLVTLTDCREKDPRPELHTSYERDLSTRWPQDAPLSVNWL